MPHRSKHSPSGLTDVRLSGEVLRQGGQRPPATGGEHESNRGRDAGRRSRAP
jgi:hypothetical protein